MVVGGQKHERGVVSAASYEARKFGVHSRHASADCGETLSACHFCRGHPDRYRESSEKVHHVLTSFSPLVEMALIDEALSRYDGH